MVQSEASTEMWFRVYRVVINIRVMHSVRHKK